MDFKQGKDNNLTRDGTCRKSSRLMPLNLKENPDEQQQRLEQLIEELSQLDPQTLETLQLQVSMTSPMMGKNADGHVASTNLSVEELACLMIYEEDYSAQCKTNDKSMPFDEEPSSGPLRNKKKQEQPSDCFSSQMKVNLRKNDYHGSSSEEDFDDPLESPSFGFKQLPPQGKSESTAENSKVSNNSNSTPSFSLLVASHQAQNEDDTEKAANAKKPISEPAQEQEEEKKEPGMDAAQDRIVIMPSFRKSKSFTENAAALVRENLSQSSPTASTKKRIEIGKMIASMEEKIDEVEDDGQSEDDSIDTDSEDDSEDDSEEGFEFSPKKKESKDKGKTMKDNACRKSFISEKSLISNPEASIDDKIYEVDMQDSGDSSSADGQSVSVASSRVSKRSKRKLRMQQQ